jgi:hypothetical protein
VCRICVPGSSRRPMSELREKVLSAYRERTERDR